MLTRGVIAGLVASIIAVGCAISTRTGSIEVPDLAHLPQPVQKTAREQIAGGTIVRIMRQGAGGVAMYRIECTKAEGKWQFGIAPDGKLLVSSEEVKLAEAPVAVQRTIQRNASNAQIESIMKVTEGSQESYEAAITVNGQERTLIMAPDGSLFDIQVAPQAVTPGRNQPDTSGETPADQLRRQRRYPGIPAPSAPAGIP